MEFSYDKKKYPMGPFVRSHEDLPPNEREIYELLDLIVAEWESDPMSVQCFDLRIVERAKKTVEPFRKLKRLSRP